MAQKPVLRGEVLSELELVQSHMAQKPVLRGEVGCTDLTRNTRAPHFTPQHWLLCHMGLC